MYHIAAVNLACSFMKPIPSPYVVLLEYSKKKQYCASRGKSNCTVLGVRYLVAGIEGFTVFE